MKKLFSFFAGIIIFSGLLSAQISLDPSHDFYASVINWQTKKLISSVPPVRPYAVSNIKEILNTVIENGNEKDKELAQMYMEELTGKPWNVSLKVEAADSLKNTENDFLINMEPMVCGNAAFFDDMISMGYKAGFSIRNKFDMSTFYPLYSEYSSDGRFDPATVGEMNMCLDVNDVISFSKNGFIVQAGINRQGYGDLLNQGLALNDSAFHKPSIVFTYMNKYISYTQQLSMMGATLVSGENNYPKDTKYLAFHAFEYKPFNWISASFYETCVFGKRFDFSYVLPVPFMVGQSFSGYADSLMMGVRFKLTPIKNMAFTTDILVDDLSVNELVKFNWNSKNRVAWNTGMEYASDLKFLERVSLNFLFITPYTYTHWDVDDNVSELISANTLNYQNYTNCGYKVGSTLEPNSEQIKLSVDFRPMKKMKVNVYAALTEHANIVETLSADEQMMYLLADKGVYSTDGGVNTHPWGWLIWNSETSMWEKHYEYLDSAWNFMNFLNQTNKMNDWQLGISASWEVFKSKFGLLKLNASYVFEYIQNKGVDSNMLPGGSVKAEYDEVNKIYTYTYAGGTTTEKSVVIEYYKNLWTSNFEDQFSNIFTVSLEYRY